MDPIFNEIMMLALKLEENMAYAVPTSSQRPYKKFPPRPAYVAVNNIHSKPDQS